MSAVGAIWRRRVEYSKQALPSQSLPSGRGAIHRTLGDNGCYLSLISPRRGVLHTPLLHTSKGPVMSVRAWRPLATLASMLLGLGALGITLAYELVHMTGYTFGQSVYPVDDYDEGVYMATGALMANGYHLFTQIYSAQPPLFPSLLAIFDRLFGMGVPSARALLLLCGLVALAATAWVAGLTRGRIAAGVAALLLAISPEFLVYAHAIEEEMPMTALATLALALSLLWYRHRCPWLAALSGMSLGLAILVKFFAFALLVPLALLLALVVWDHRWRARAAASGDAWTGLICTVALWIAGALAPVVLSFLIFGPTEWQQMVSDRLAATQAFPGPHSTLVNLHMILTFVRTDIGLVILALLGGLTLLILDWRLGLVLDSWALAFAAVLARYHPLMGHHPVILLAPLAALAGIAVEVACSRLGSLFASLCLRFPDALLGHRHAEPLSQGSALKVADRGGNTYSRRLGALMGVLIVVSLLSYLVLLPRLWMEDTKLLLPQRPGEREAAAALVRAYTPPQGFVATGDAWIAVEAGRLSVPSLVDSSYVRIMSGRLTSQQAIAVTEHSHAATVALWPRFRYLTAYARWVRTHYRLLARFCSGSATNDCDAVYARR
jgi:4-amino-4-deoxy-L-arabinose transferase-like glycosyltransferase